jgi:hypothetical protein
MPKEKEQNGEKKKRLVICPECDTENNLNEVDECSNCGLNLEVLFTKHRYNRALKKLQEREEEEGKKGKKKSSAFDPF